MKINRIIQAVFSLIAASLGILLFQSSTVDSAHAASAGGSPEPTSSTTSGKNTNFKRGQPTHKLAGAKNGSGHYGEPIKDIIELGNGVEVMITGTDADLIEIWRDTYQIFFHRIQDVGKGANHRDLSRNDVRWVSTGGSDFNIAVRAGQERDIFFCYAVRGTNVYVVPTGRDWPAVYAFRWGKGHHDWTDYKFDWPTPNTLRVQYGPPNTLRLGFVDWDDSKKTWNCRDCDR